MIVGGRYCVLEEILHTLLSLLNIFLGISLLLIVLSQRSLVDIYQTKSLWILAASAARQDVTVLSANRKLHVDTAETGETSQRIT